MIRKEDGTRWWSVLGDWWLHSRPDGKASSRICLVKDGSRIQRGKFENGWIEAELETGEKGYLAGRTPLA